MYIVLLFVRKRLVRVEEFTNHADMAYFVMKHRKLYRCEVVPL